MATLGDGLRFHNYEIVAPLATGGMAEVYRARDLRLGRPVAIKVLAPSMQGREEQVLRFRQEAIAASALNHPNIVTIYDIGEINAVTYIAMELVQGHSLRHLMEREPLSVSVALQVGVQVAEGLAAAHGIGMVHRDLKPENIMVGPDGQVKILDFGIAKMGNLDPMSLADADTTPALTEPGTVMGTVPYMAPEQARGGVVDARTDQFALGVVLYEMVARRHPFRRATLVQTISAILDEIPESPERSNPDIPAALTLVITRCLAKHPGDRYSTTRGLVSDLRRVGQYAVGSQSKSPGAAPERRSRKRIEAVAVLPFVDESVHHDSEYLVDGITESIITALSQIPKLRVMARSTMFRYKGRDVLPQQVGHELNVGAVLLGRLSTRDDRLSLSVELVNVVDGTQLWGGQYKRPLADMIVAIEAEIARDIATKLGPRLSGRQRRIPAAAVANSEAYQRYLRGRFFWNKRTPEGIQKAIDYFRQAIALDDTFASAHAGLADCYTVLGAGEYGLIPPGEAFANARISATRAIELDDRIAEAHTSLAYVRFAYDWDWVAAEQEFLKALDINPSYVMARIWYSTLLTETGRLDEGVAEARRALELDPLSAGTRFYLVFALFMARQWDAAIAECHTVLELDPSYVRVYVLLGPALRRVGRFDEAAAVVQRLIDAWGRTPFLAALLATIYADGGKVSDASAIRDELYALRDSRYVAPYDIARVHVSLGEIDKAFEWLERVFEERSGWLLQLKVSPQLDPIRSDPRYEDLLRRVGLPR